MTQPAISGPLSGAAPGVTGRDSLSARGLTGTEVLDESSFRRMLCLERKRSERSRRRFVLALLESAPLLKPQADGVGQDLAAAVLRSLSRSTRDTDLKGWYESGSVIGIIFTEIGEADGKAITNAILTRITGALSSALGIEHLNAIRLSFYVFPETQGETGSACPPASPLYPDLAPHMAMKRVPLIVKRAIDISGSLLALIMLSPLLLIAAAAIKCTSKGPVLFRQERIGQYGKKFTFLKFRSMYSGNDDTVHKNYVASLIAGKTASQNGTARIYKLTNDPRITPLGRILRRTSVDELPQLINVLIGQMSLVGPRPPIPYEYENYDIWHRRRLLAVKPGITGLWQVGGRSTVTFDDMIRMDLSYASAWSLWLDISILLRTPRAVLLGEGAY
jgi:lipopolysaccharide/colanic/teichoic acid biosynthesis glycosyltransferase